jgi:hypothetical protein
MVDSNFSGEPQPVVYVGTSSLSLLFRGPPRRAKKDERTTHVGLTTL